MGTAVLFCTWPIETIQVETPRSSAWAPLFSVASVEVESVRGERNVHIRDVRGLLPTPLTNGDAGWCSLSVALPLHCRGKLSTPRILQGMLLSTCEEQRERAEINKQNSNHENLVAWHIISRCTNLCRAVPIFICLKTKILPLWEGKPHRFLLGRYIRSLAPLTN